MARTDEAGSLYGESFDSEYAALPESIKVLYSPKEYAWLDPTIRSKLIEQETLPDVAED